MVGVEGERHAVGVLLAEAREARHGRLAEGAVYPAARRAPGELGGGGRIRQRGASAEQRVTVNAVVDGAVANGHGFPFLWGPVRAGRRQVIANEQACRLARLRNTTWLPWLNCSAGLVVAG